MKPGWEWTENNFAAVKQLLSANVRAAVEETAYDVTEAAQARCPVDTGALRASIHPVFEGSSGHGAAVGSAIVLGRKKYGAKIADRMGAALGVRPQSMGEIAAAVDVAATYGAFVEFGAMNARAGRWVPGQPYFVPGVESCTSEFERRLQKALEFKKARMAKVTTAVSDDDARDAYYRSQFASVSRETNEWKAAVLDDLRGSTTASSMQRLAYGQNRTRTGKQYRETFGEMWERLRNDYENKRNFD